MEIFVAFITLLSGFLGAMLCQRLLDWVDGGTVIAVAVMGGFILRYIRDLQDSLKKDDKAE